MPTVLSFPIMPRPKIEDLPNRVRYWRKQRGLTLRQLAPIVGIAFPSLGKIETGKLDLRHYWMERIAAALDVAPADLLPLGHGGLTEKERELVETYRELPEANRRVIDGVKDTLQPWRGPPETVEFRKPDAWKRHRSG